MKLHGHTTIELTDVNTGKKEVYDDDNIVTNYLPKLLGINYNFYPVLPFNCNSYLSNKEEIVKKATCGLMLFDKAIPENENTFIAPAESEVVGVGNNIAYSGSNLAVGSYNVSESGWVDNSKKSYKHVWDFDTSHGNGEISCACLTTIFGGRITEGTMYNDSSLYFTDFGNQSLYSKYLYNSGSQRLPTFNVGGNGSELSIPISTFFFADYENDTLYGPKFDYEGLRECFSIMSNATDYSNHFSSKKYIDIYKYHLNMKKCNLFISDRENETYKYPYDSVRVQMPAELSAAIDSITNVKKILVNWFSDENNINIIFTVKETLDSSEDEIMSQNEKFYVWRIDVKTFTSTHFICTNTTGERIMMRGISSASNNFSSIRNEKSILVFDNTVLMIGYNSKKLYRMRLSNNTDVSIVKNPDGSDEVMRSNYIEFLHYAKNKVLYNFTSSLTNKIFNAALDKLYYCCGDGHAFNRFNSSYSVIKVSNSPLLIGQANQYDYYLGELFAPLITINNLQQTVTKTSSQSMKVTYTITESNI